MKRKAIKRNKKIKLNNDEGNIGIITEERIKEIEEDKDDEIRRLNKIVDRLEQRIATLEKVLESHAQCIGAIRKICDE
jgi:hypothetical protein|tara:strand:- start:822 stop:1055 length:234 start_codon:yes stop_codon:yes gene_type:complete